MSATFWTPRQKYKSSAVAEMGDRLATIDMGRKEGGAAVRLSDGGGEAGPHLTQCRLGRGLPPYRVASLIHAAVWRQYMGQNWQRGAMPHFLQEGVPI